MLVAILECVGGLMVLWGASELLVEYSSRFGRRMKISSFLIGIVVVGLGTSVPELTVSSLAAAQGDLDLAVGNIVGSNSANLSLALGTAALAAMGLSLNNPGLKRLVLVSSLSVGLFAVLVQGYFAVYEGIILLVLVIPVVWFLYRLEKSGISTLQNPVLDPAQGPMWKILGGLFVGLGGTVFGAQLLVWGTGDLAKEISVETGFLGLTLVALGTSAPEIIIGIRSGLKRETGILAGNLLGSNISNSLIVGGVVGILGPGSVSDATLTTLAVPIMFGLCVLGGILMIIGRNITRTEAIILIGVWIAMLPFVA